MRWRGLVFFAVSLLTTFGSARAELPAPDQARQILADSARPFVRTLSRDVHMFHWTNAFNSADPPLAPMDERLRGYVGFIKDLFWRSDVGYAGNNVGNGFYVAIDPVISHDFGHVLLQIIVPAQIRFLHLDPQAPPADVRDAAAALGCDQGDLRHIFIAADVVPACRALRDQLIADLQIQAIRYDWTSTTQLICGRDAPWAFVLFDDRAIRYDRIVSFDSRQVPDPSDAHAENRLILNAVAKRAGNRLWPKLESETSADIDAWARDNLYGCGAEDQP
jgi:hypothetical protein